LGSELEGGATASVTAAVDTKPDEICIGVGESR